MKKTAIPLIIFGSLCLTSIGWAETFKMDKTTLSMESRRTEMMFRTSHHDETAIANATVAMMGFLKTHLSDEEYAETITYKARKNFMDFFEKGKNTSLEGQIFNQYFLKYRNMGNQTVVRDVEKFEREESDIYRAFERKYKNEYLSYDEILEKTKKE